ncbi:hypothetical protein RN001_005520 [Aquatica leii]|uniref:Major facilitator superfamily domain-containing protein 12-like n=1 Tax=Aquatica leii TaxID=1421715 RepID=A0AAN7PJZ9_9COLE|nr:hypothetical protein RN001_005520 [Aquatica leii]
MEGETQQLLEETEKLSLSTRLAYGVGHVLNDICSSMWFTYLLVFLHLVLKFDHWEAGFLLLVGQVADAIANPFVGYQSDQRDTLWICKYGQRKIWHLVGTLCVLIGFPFIFLPCLNTDSHRWVQLFYYSVFIIIFQFGWAAVQIAHLSIMPELTPDEHERTRLAATRYCFTVISNVLVYFVSWVVFGYDDGNDKQISPSDAFEFQKIVWAGLSVGIVCTIIYHMLIHEDNSVFHDHHEKNKISLGIFQILGNFRYYQAAIVYMSTMLYINLTQVFVPLYLHETLDMSASALAKIPLVIYLGSLATSFVVGSLNKYLGRKLAYVSGACIGLAACAWVHVRSHSPDFTYYEIYVVAIMFGITSSIILVTNLGVTADAIGDKTGSGAFVYGIMCFTDKLSNGIAVFLIQDYHKSFPDTSYYGQVLSFICGSALILGSLGVISLSICKPKNKYYTLVP